MLDPQRQVDFDTSLATVRRWKRETNTLSLLLDGEDSKL